MLAQRVLAFRERTSQSNERDREWDGEGGGGRRGEKFKSSLGIKRIPRNPRHFLDDNVLLEINVTGRTTRNVVAREFMDRTRWRRLAADGVDSQRK